MKTKAKNRLVTAIFFALVAAFFCAIAGTVPVKAQEVFAIDENTVVMERGAALRISADGESGKTGLTYTARISAENYAAIETNTGENELFKDVEYGIVIAPDVYNETYGALNDPANLFGTAAVYDWARYESDGAGGYEWVYDGDKTRIMVFETTQPYFDETKGDYFLKGTIANILCDEERNNMCTEFYGTAYIGYTDATGAKRYVFAEENENVCSPAGLAQAYILSGTLEEGDMALVQGDYLDKVRESDRKTTYTVNTYLEGMSGNTLHESKVVPDADIFAADGFNKVSVAAEPIEGYQYNGAVSRAEGTVLFGGRLALDLVYVPVIDEDLGARTARSLDLGEYFTPSYTAFEVQKKNAAGDFETVEAEISERVLNTENLAGTYKVVASGENLSQTSQIVFVQETVYNTVTDRSLFASSAGTAFGIVNGAEEGLPQKDVYFYKFSYNVSQAGWTHIKVLPEREKAYFQALPAGAMLAFDWYYTHTDPSVDYKAAFRWIGNTDESTVMEKNTKHTVRIAMADVLANWDALVSGSVGDSNYFLFIRDSANEYETNVYIGNFRILEPSLDDEENVYNQVTDSASVIHNGYSLGVVTVENEQEKTYANYYRWVLSANNAAWNWITVLPEREKTFYEALPEGSVLTFEWWYTYADPSVAGIDVQFLLFGQENKVGVEKDKKQTLRIPIADILEIWDKFPTGNGGSANGTAFIYLQDERNKSETIFYLGNFRVDTP